MAAEIVELESTDGRVITVEVIAVLNQKVAVRRTSDKKVFEVPFDRLNLISRERAIKAGKRLAEGLSQPTPAAKAGDQLMPPPPTPTAALPDPVQTSAEAKAEQARQQAAAKAEAEKLAAATTAPPEPRSQSPQPGSQPKEAASGTKPKLNDGLVGTDVMAADDAEILAAAEKARGSFPERWTQHSTQFPDHAQRPMVLIKASFSAPSRPANADEPAPKEPLQDEMMWVEVGRFDGTIITGILKNDPARLDSVKAGDAVTIPLPRLQDWLILNEKGTADGGYTLRVQRDRLKEGPPRQDFEKSLGVRLAP